MNKKTLARVFAFFKKLKITNNWYKKWQFIQTKIKLHIHTYTSTVLIVRNLPAKWSICGPLLGCTSDQQLLRLQQLLLLLAYPACDSCQKLLWQKMQEQIFIVSEYHRMAEDEPFSHMHEHDRAIERNKQKGVNGNADAT
jgi:hypothetical protein